MTRDPAMLAECRALIAALVPYPSLAALHASREWAELGPRLGRLLNTVHLHTPAAPPAATADPERVRALHWNIEHGNWYDQVERALTTQPQLAGLDLCLFNEIDLGMARVGNRDVAADLAAALGLYGAWAPLFLETTIGRDDDAEAAAGRENQESLFGVAILSRWPIGATRIVELPSPSIQFDVERMYGRHIALIAEIERPGAPFVAVSAHLEVHRTRAHRAAQIATVLDALRQETRPIVLAGDFNSHTFDRGRWWDPWLGAIVMLLWPDRALRRRLRHPDQGGGRERLFDRLRESNFEWQRFNDRTPTLLLRFERLDEARGLFRLAGPIVTPMLARAQARGSLRLDWFAGRGWREGRGTTVRGLDGLGKASDHAPILAEFGA
jgi:endonuclease/exonuclease/phosphatase family metal-dependent hydrolase